MEERSMTDLFVPSPAVHPKITQAQCKLGVFHVMLRWIFFFQA